MNRTLFALLICLAAGPAAASSPGDAATAQDRFNEDLAVLTSVPHRMAGSPEGRQVAAYISRRLAEIGVRDVLTLQMPVWHCEAVRCEMTAEGVSVDLLPMQPNITIHPVTPPEGITGPYLYAGTGEPWEYGARSAAGAIVGLDYDSRDNWKAAFALGARAVVFLGSDDAVSTDPKMAGVPVNLVRLYAPVQALSRFDFRSDHASVTVVSQVRWNKSVGTNILAFLPGTRPVFDGIRREPEMAVLSSHFDTWGEVPLRSPSAREAANVAALLGSVAYLKEHRPRRDLLFMFLDGRAHYHQGAREAYIALMGDSVKLNDFFGGNLDEQQFCRDLLAGLGRKPSAAGAVFEARPALMRRFDNLAEHCRADENIELQKVRLALSELDRPDPALAAERDRLVKTVGMWDDTRRALTEKNLAAVHPDYLDRLRLLAREQIERRLKELDMMIAVGEQRTALRRLCGKNWVAVHVTYDFGDRAGQWGLMIGDQTDEPFRRTDPNADHPGYYMRVLRAFRGGLDRVSGLSVNPESLKDPLVAQHYMQGRFAADGMVAGVYGVYNVTLSTCHDGRPRDGHPADLPGNLDAAWVRRQADEANRLLADVFSSEELCLQRVFSNLAQWSSPEWSNEKSKGNYVGLQMTGSMAEDRPAMDAVLAIWPGAAWTAPRTTDAIPGFNRFSLEQVSANGRYGISGVRKDEFAAMIVLGAMFDTMGAVSAISSSATIASMARINLFPSRGYGVGYPLTTFTTDRGPLKIMDANANASFNGDRSLSGGGDGFAFIYLNRNDPVRRIKIFNTTGPVMLGASLENPYGNGFDLTATGQGLPSADKVTAEDLWNLNESRLGLLRRKSVSDVELESLHGRARKLLEKARQADGEAQRQACFAQSAAISRQVYSPLRSVMDDLIKAIVILLLLAIPFAFALERLLICASSIYLRIAGFSAAFIVTFILLYLMHPGFSIAATPIIVFLAFAIILLSSLVINIMTRKFKNELMVFQGKSSKLHQVEISRMGTLLVAVNMGMSTMRRRPVRTALTALTAIMLTFTILCFASFSNQFGIRSFYTGAASENTPASFLVRDVNYQPITPQLLRIIHGRQGADGLVSQQWWLTRQTGSTRPAVSVVRAADGRTVFLDGLLGISPAEMERWPLLRTAAGGQPADSALERDGLFLPVIVQRQLGLSQGDPLTVNGYRTFFAGAIRESELQRIKHLDGFSLLPVDAQDLAYQAMLKQQTSAAAASGGAAATGGDKVQAQRDFTRLGANQIAIGSDRLARTLGATIHLIGIYPAKDVPVEEEGRRLAEIVSLPVWVKSVDGVFRMIFTRLVEVSGGFALFVPVLLGGLIIFGTLLGSITDRQKEIYTFSALGLGPAHVGFLFVAEAAVYAVVGGMGGQLLAQGLAYGANLLAGAGYIQQPSINFSSTHSLFAIGIVMLTVLVSAIYPAVKASRSANPGIQRTWKMTSPKGDLLEMKFPFTVSSYDITGVVSFLAEHFRSHDDAGLGNFAASNVRISRSETDGHLQVSALLSLAPFDLGITQQFMLTAIPSEIKGVDEVFIRAERESGTPADWHRANRVFIHELRKQFLLWRTLATENIEQYRMQTLQYLGEKTGPAAAATEVPS